MKKQLLFFLVIIAIHFLFATENKNLEKSLRLIKINSEIEVDGKIDDVWSTADSTTNFFQLEPYYESANIVKTVAKVLTTDEALYCLMICYDDKKLFRQMQECMMDLPVI